MNPKEFEGPGWHTIDQACIKLGTSHCYQVESGKWGCGAKRHLVFFQREMRDTVVCEGITIKKISDKPLESVMWVRQFPKRDAEAYVARIFAPFREV